jgi:hypothetical protein
MSEWISLNIPIKRMCRKKYSTLSKNIKKPKIENYLKLDFSLNKLNIYFSDVSKIEKVNHIYSFSIKDLIQKNFFDEYGSYINELLVMEQLLKTKIDILFAINKTKYFIQNNKHSNTLVENFNKLVKFQESLNSKEINSFMKDVVKYFEKLDEVSLECKFVTCSYNKPGYFIYLIDNRTDEVKSFLIGHGSDIVKYFKEDIKHLIVLRAKQIVSDDELVGLHIFE